MKDDYPKGFENFKPADYEFEVAYFSTDEMRDKLLSANNSGTLPDIVFVDPAHLPELVRLDILLPLDTELDNFSDIHSNLIENTKDTGVYGEHIYGLPYSLSSQSIIYNPAIFADAEIDPPAEFSSLYSTLENLSKNNEDITGFAAGGMDIAGAAPFIWSNDGTLISDDQTQASGYINSKANKTTFATLMSMYENGIFADEQDLGGKNSTADKFANGKIAMMFASPATTAYLNNTYPDFEYAHLSELPEYSGYTTVFETSLLCVPNRENKELGLTVAKAFMEEEWQKEFFNYGVVPANELLFESEEIQESAYRPFFAVLQGAKPLPSFEQMQDFNNELEITIQQIEGGYKDIDQAFDELAEKWDALLS